MKLLFSIQMFSHQNKQFKARVASAKNTPVENGAIDLDENESVEIEQILDHILSKDITEDVDSKMKVERPDAHKNNQIKSEDEYYSDSSDDWTDISDSEIEYPARFVTSRQRQVEADSHNTNIIDLPQFILVFTAFKAEDTVIIPPNDLLPEYLRVENESPPKKASKPMLSEEKSKNREIIKKHKALISRKSPKHSALRKPDEAATAPKVVRRIKYVRYSAPTDVVQREREIQVGSHPTTEASVQCDLEGADSGNREESPQLEWINHIIEAHVLSDENNMYECHICGEIALSYASKEKHSLIHKEPSLLCFECGMHFRTAEKLKSHERQSHQKNPFEIKKALRCPKLYCTKAFHSKKQLFKHIDDHAKKTEQRCSRCQRSFYSLFQYHVHKSKRNCWR